MTSLQTAILVLALLPAASFAQTEAGSIPAGTPLALSIGKNYRMRAGEPIRAHLLYPIYANNKLILPKDTVVTGSVVGLRPDRTRRVHAMLGGDFTPFHTPEVRFTQIILADGTAVPLTSDVATNGAPIYRAVAPPPSKGGFFRQEFNSGATAVRGDIAAFTAPGKGDRLLQFIYSQLPYHPERIAKGTSWTVETATAADLPAEPAPSVIPPPPAHKRHIWDQPDPAAQLPTNDTGAWIVQANLTDALSSETSQTGQAIKAVVAEPIYNLDHTVAVPQGATLIGSVTRARHSRSFGRTGTLSFRFNQLVLPNAETQTIETRLTGADSAADIALNSEGQAKSKPQDKVAIPLFLAALASRPLDTDNGRSHHMRGKEAGGGAAGLGLAGTIIGLAGGSPYAAAGIGYWGAARSVYGRWIAHGQQITFVKDTRIVVETTPRRSAPIKPDAQPAP